MLDAYSFHTLNTGLLFLVGDVMKKIFTKHKLTLAGSVLAVGLVSWAGLGLQSCGDGNGLFEGSHTMRFCTGGLS